MANEKVGVEALEEDILERAGIEKRDDLPITIECAWGVNTDGSPRVFQVGEVHPLLPDHLIFAILQNPVELKIYSLCPQKNGAPPKNPKEEMRTNPTRMTLVKTSRCTMTEIMILDVFVESIAQDLVMLEIETYGERENIEEATTRIKEKILEALKPFPEAFKACENALKEMEEPPPLSKPQLVTSPTGP